MKWHRTAACWRSSACSAAGRPYAQGAAPQAADGRPRPRDADVAPLFRVFLKDGTSLVSYGEMARVDDRVVFSMPTSASDASAAAAAH